MRGDARRRRGSHPKLLWLWCRLAATAPIRPLAWELPYAEGTTLKRPKIRPLAWELPYAEGTTLKRPKKKKSLKKITN